MRTLTFNVDGKLLAFIEKTRIKRAAKQIRLAAERRLLGMVLAKFP